MLRLTKERAPTPTPSKMKVKMVLRFFWVQTWLCEGEGAVLQATHSAAVPASS